MDPRYTIALARRRDLPALAEIERAAGRLFVGRVPAALLLETTDDEEFADDAPVGFALVEMLAPDAPHLEEVDVHPDHGRRGIGAALVRAVLAWAAASGHRALTLTTFRDVPWNLPFYERLGFEELPPGELSPVLAAVVRAEP